MKSLVLALLLLLGFGAQSALACTDRAAAAHNQATMAGADRTTAVDFDRLAREQRCDCPAQTQAAQATVAESTKIALAASFDSSAVLPDASSAALRRALDSHDRLLSDASPDSALPLYLLTARLRC